MNKKQKKNLIRIMVTGLLMMIISWSQAEGFLRFGLYLIPYFLIGYDVLYKALMGVKNKQPFDESLLMSIATVGAIILGLIKTGDYVEAIAVMLFYQIGEWFQSYAVGRSRKNIADLMDIAPDYANIEGQAGGLVQVDPDEVEIGTIIVVKPGEKIPLDGHVVEGTSSLNTSALTGESLPKDVGPEDQVISGSINLNGLLKIRTDKEFDESTASKIIELMEDASSRKSQSENFITKFSRMYTPVVVYAALGLALIPPIVRGLMGLDPIWAEWIYRSLTFLIISCPCALVLSVPLTFFAGIGGASRFGILIKGSNYLEALASVDTIVYDKTGTLTEGNFKVSHIESKGISSHDLLHLAAHVERYSDHPIGISLKEAFGREEDGCQVQDVEEIAGQGVWARVNGKRVCVGNLRMMESLGIKTDSVSKIGSLVHVVREGEYLGYIVISDQIKKESKDAIDVLSTLGLKKQYMLTGDTREVANEVARYLAVDRVYPLLLPQDKVRVLEELMEEKKDPKATVVFVGDGINDAPVLSRADIGVAMGAMGSDAAIEAADVVLMDDNPLKMATAIRIAKKTMTIVKENTYFAIGVKFLVLGLSTFGLANLWAAVFADVGVTVLAVLNAMRAMYIKDISSNKMV